MLLVLLVLGLFTVNEALEASGDLATMQIGNSLLWSGKTRTRVFTTLLP